ncbi:hypothetical protein FOA52_001414 [Chlamydomonas sp. UWO 241]|nr:hypothetical protein FOA52_001414 [Chlamydomonas sp. UWO 241]
MLVDAQSVIPRDLFPKFARDMLDWHIATNNDWLVQTNPPWFVALVYGEVLLQLPFFFVACYAFAQKKAWIRMPALIYGVHTATTMVPILGEIIGKKNYILAAIYSPYLVVPLLLAVKMCMCEDPFEYVRKGPFGKRPKRS